MRIKDLSPKEKEALAFIFDLPQYRIFKKYLENERFNIATKTLTLDPQEMTEMARLQGQAQALKLLHQRLKQIHKEQVKD